MLNLPCKTVQDYPARLHASYCATLQRVGYLARCCTQYVARYLAGNIASCRQAFRLSKCMPIFYNVLFQLYDNIELNYVILVTHFYLRTANKRVYLAN